MVEAAHRTWQRCTATAPNIARAAPNILLLYLRCTITCVRCTAEKATEQQQQRVKDGKVEHRRALSAPHTLTTSRRQSSSSVSSASAFIPPSQSPNKHKRAVSAAEASVPSPPSHPVGLPASLVCIVLGESPQSLITNKQSARSRRAQSIGPGPLYSSVFRERQDIVQPTGTLLPLTIDGVAELVNVLASLTSVCSALLMLAPTSDSTFHAIMSIDLISATLWLLDSLCYCRAWQLSAQCATSDSRCWWRPQSIWWWSNVLNVGASLVYVAVAVMGWMVVWVGGRGMEVVVEQRAAFVVGDVLYLLCAVVCQWAWLLDRKRAAV